ncbi:unnamed protein product (macronuclear) [Paramecium tetraurelia]|uniref:Uncharacterized protein n=1 Tax=Paramecium tetraurelia TaxID=5888 RepID=A0E3V4_PARTE|nr:uncharacterized protein GSPATT00023144001 [Paramecium tetraurelia]CAK89971.1 unnamed protein product [Paramecium tetraurelia]|eukprot:XP_001457368.1 hypothetical protein (macronuclear) [Paramecium tetraurelia strain d4-2]
MLLKLKQDIESLLDNVQAFKKESRPIYPNLKDQLDEKVNLIKQQFNNVDDKIMKNYCTKILELKQINKIMQDLKITLDIQIIPGPSNLKKSHMLIQQESKETAASLQKKILLKLNQLTELIEINELANYNGNEFEGICIFRLHQIYHNEVENLQQQFQQLKSFNNERFNRLQQSFSDIINDSKFIKLQEQISQYSEIANLLDDLRDKLFEIIKSKNDSISIMDRTKSLQNLSSASQDYEEDEHYEIKRGKYQNPLKQEEIKNKRKESSSETCINCLIF